MLQKRREDGLIGCGVFQQESRQMPHHFFMNRLQAVRRRRGRSCIFRRRSSWRRNLGGVEAEFDVTSGEMHLGGALEFGEDMDEESQDVESDVFGQRGAAEQLEEAVEQRHEEAD